MTSFERALKFVLEREGGYVNDPNDPGGETKYGISKRAYPALNIRDLTVEHAGEIYRTGYWEPAGCEALPDALALVVFDTAVNCGVGRALAWRKATKTVEAYLWLRLAFYRELAQKRPSLLKFLPGWVRRLELLRAAAAL